MLSEKEVEILDFNGRKIKDQKVKEDYFELLRSHMQLQRKNKQMKEALEFYADKQIYEAHFGGVDGIAMYGPDVIDDNGEKARTVLQSLQGSDTK